MQQNLLISVNTHATRRTAPVRGICFTLNNSTSSRLKLHSNSNIFHVPATSKHVRPTQPYHVHCKQFEYACRHCAMAPCREAYSRRGMLAVRLSDFQVAYAEERNRGCEWAWLLLSTLGHGGECTALVSDLSCVCCSCATDAVRRARLSFATATNTL